MVTKIQKRITWAILLLGFVFLYAPIFALMVYSFNDASSITAWSKPSLRWYQTLFEDLEVYQAFLFSIKIALLTATASVVIGTWIGYVMGRFARFRGHTGFRAMVIAPLVIPEVIQGIALLLFFVFLEQVTGWPGERGLVTIWIGHVMLCVSFVAIMVQSRVQQLDRSLEDAAMDLGASSARVFVDITLPLISQALLSGWVLAFTISIDDLILSAYLSGPGATTLPMLVFSRVRTGVNPEINALATVMVVVVASSILIANAVSQHISRKRNIPR